VSVSGALLFARYAYPPNQLGYCGPDGAEALLRADAPAEIARRARRFEGAWSYLEFLAGVAGVDDPLDETVVAAYWVGGALLDRVDPGALVAWLRTRFVGQSGGTWADADDRALPHHSFQVFEVYPWAEMLRRNPNPVALSVLDRCRIRVGEVVAVHGETATVRCRPLLVDLVPGPPVEETVTWSVAGRSLLGGLASGDTVALHWDWVCDVLAPDQREWLEKLEERQRDVIAT
jgi:hypothetical protein